MLGKFIKGITRIVVVIFTINWIKLIKIYDKKAAVIVWIPRKKINYLFGDSFLWDFAAIHALVKNGVSFKIYHGNKIGNFSNKKILHTINRGINEFGFSDYTNVYSHIVPQLERQGNTVFPNTHEVSFWENKGFMHKKFKEASVSEPETKLLSFDEIKNDANFKYPFLIKAEHACSANGVFKISNQEELHALINSKSFQLENNIVIKQELINMRKDLRVILVGDEIVHHYWRINLAKEWKPTSTSFGSQVDFDNFPEKWRQHMIETFKRLKITTGAFDVTWHDDNLETEPLYLEVSPGYQPNPRIELKGKEYAHYKNSFSPFNAYDKLFVALVFTIKEKQINALINQNFFKR